MARYESKGAGDWVCLSILRASGTTAPPLTAGRDFCGTVMFFRNGESCHGDK